MDVSENGPDDDGSPLDRSIVAHRVHVGRPLPPQCAGAPESAVYEHEVTERELRPYRHLDVSESIENLRILADELGEMIPDDEKALLVKCGADRRLDANALLENSRELQVCDLQAQLLSGNLLYHVLPPLHHNIGAGRIYIIGDDI